MPSTDIDETRRIAPEESGIALSEHALMLTRNRPTPIFALDRRRIEVTPEPAVETPAAETSVRKLRVRTARTGRWFWAVFILVAGVLAILFALPEHDTTSHDANAPPPPGKTAHR